MSWWFLIFGLSTLVVIGVAIALVARVRHHMEASPPPARTPDDAGKAEGKAP